ncbi:ADP-ribosylglycohydrolase family protein [Bremerella sp. JC817]|uniref:ADP-ribosylglycohydrolase family protein n=1 Tax=Bremerella sp. JC817 TaxID=3231756 RepID=UPI0034580231
MNEKAIEGCLLGTAVGDALGLPFEGLSKKRGQKLFGGADDFHFLLGRGMVSDDTEHTCIVAQSLVLSAGNVETFQKALASRFRRWILLLPAGVGMATAKACIRLLVGYSAKTSGVWSAGNGPAMRSAILGAYFGDDLPSMQSFVQCNARITHTDPQAELGAFAIALAASLASRGRQVVSHEFVDTFQKMTSQRPESSPFVQLLKPVAQSIDRGESTAEFAQSIGLGQRVGGYVGHSVPVVLHCWLSNQTDFSKAIISMIECGGDTDTNAAMVGGIVGARVGKEGIPQRWIDGMYEWPMTIERMSQLAIQLAKSKDSQVAAKPVSVGAIGVLLRNVFFLLVVLFHGFRRLLPPY